jgi:hypothetical protein
MTIDGIAAREARSKRHIDMTISLAFLAPSLVEVVVEGRLAARNRCRPPVQCTGHVVAPASDNGLHANAAFAKHSGNLPRNRLVVSLSPASPTTQSCANPVSWRRQNSL